MAAARSSRRSLAALALGLLLAPLAAPATTITLFDQDGPGEGLNDPAPRAPVGGNTGTTLGQQRQIALQYAATIWQNTIQSSVEIRAGVEFNALACNGTSAVGGNAGANSVHENFAGTLRTDTWYVQALANSLAGTDLDPGSDDLDATFNVSIDSGTCLTGFTWYYGLDGNPGPTQIDFVTVALHELAHGLGFVAFVDMASGAKLSGHDDTYMVNLEDHSLGQTWPSMSDAERAASVVDSGDLHWVGSNVRAASAALSAGKVGDHVRMYAPNPLSWGSSVNHFDTALAPNELLEPSYTTNAARTVTNALMRDIGWLLAGDPTRTPTPTPTFTASETPTPTPTRTPTATATRTPTISPTRTPTRTATLTPTGTSTATPSGTPTPTSTVLPALCPATPRPACAPPGRSLLSLRDDTDPARRRVIWKWKLGTITGGELGDPLGGGTAYRLCIYGDGALFMDAGVAPDGYWSALSAGFRYKNKLTNSDGVLSLLLKLGAGNAVVRFKAKGSSVPLPPLPPGQTSAVTVQLVKNDGSECWQSVYLPPPLRGDSGSFKDDE